MKKEQILKEIQMKKTKKSNKKYNLQKIHKAKVIIKRKKQMYPNKQRIMILTKKTYKQIMKKTIFKRSSYLKNKNIK